MSHKTTFYWILHTGFSELLHWTVVISAMLKIGFCKKVHILGFVNEPMTCSCISLFYVKVGVCLNKSFLSVTEIITGYRCMVHLPSLMTITESWPRKYSS